MGRLDVNHAADPPLHINDVNQWKSKTLCGLAPGDMIKRGV